MVKLRLYGRIVTHCSLRNGSDGKLQRKAGGAESSKAAATGNRVTPDQRLQARDPRASLRPESVRVRPLAQLPRSDRNTPSLFCRGGSLVLLVHGPRTKAHGPNPLVRQR